MRFTITTHISKNHNLVYDKFDENLFRFLTPSEKQMRLLHFGGKNVKDIVHLQFLKPYKADWISEITEEKTSDTENYFIDEGTTLPFGLKRWKHKHIVRRINDNECDIIDDISFSTGWLLLDLFYFPGLYLAFYPRKKLYKKYFHGTT